MSTVELKFQLHQLIDKTNDSTLLDKAYTALSKLFTKQQTTDWWDNITAEEKALINKGRQQLKNGEGIPHAEVRKEINKLLGK